MKKQSAFRAILATGVALMALPTAAYAQNADEAPADTIIVTGQRQPYVGNTPIKDIPQNIQTISTETLNAVGAKTLGAALELVSGVAPLNNFGGLWDGYAVRGFAGDSNNVPTGMLVNGFNGGRGFSGPRDASSVEQIQVLKGPTSAMFGRGEPGGTVNVITKKPLFNTQGYITLQGGSWNQFRAEADFTTPLSDNFAIRINGAYEEGDSYRDTVHTKKVFITPSILWKMSDRTSLAYEFEYANQKIPFDRGIPIFNNDFTRLPPTRYLGEPGDGPVKAEVFGHQLTFQHDFNDNWSLLAGFGYRTTSLQGIGEYPEFAAARQPYFTTGTILARQRRSLDFDSKDLTLRAEINGKFSMGSMLNHVVLGMDYNKFELDQIQTRFRPGAFNANSTLASINAIDVFNPVYGAYPAPNAFTSNVFNKIEVDHSWGFYFSDQVDVTDWLKVRAGGRYDEFRQTITDRLNAPNSTPGTATPLNPSRQTVNRFSPQFGLVIQPTRTLSIYATYGEGFRPNNGQAFGGDTFAPETSKAYELGAKFTSPDQRITATLALFTMDKTNVLTADPNPAHSGFVIAIGAARSRGFEFDLDAKLPADFHLILAYAYTDAFSLSTVLDPDFAKPILPGDPLINVPKNSASVLLTKDFRLGEDRKAMFGVGLQYIDRRLGETATNYFLPSATLVKLVGSFDVTSHIRINASVNNLFDKRWFANSYAALWTFPGAPRNFKVSATYKF